MNYIREELLRQQTLWAALASAREDPAEEERRIAREKAEATAARKAARAVRKMERAQRNAVL